MSIIIALFGPSGSGKSEWKKRFVNAGWTNIKSYTTRPKRTHEDNEYHFCSGDKVSELISSNKLVNFNLYENFIYAVSARELTRIKTPAVLITHISTIPKLKEEMANFGKDLKLVFCRPPEEESLQIEIHKKRGTESRIAITKMEVEYFKNYKPDYNYELVYGRDLEFNEINRLKEI